MLVDQVADAEVRSAEQAAPQPERRAAARHRTVFWIARVASDHDVGLWRVQNISNRGMMLQTHTEVSPGEHLTVTLSEGCTLSGAVKWSDGQHCGIQFDEPIRCDSVLSMLAADRRSARFRSPRLPVARTATAWCEHGLQSVRIANISQHGIGFTHDGRIQAGMQLKLRMENGLERRGVVRWSHDGQSGLRLLDPFSAVELESRNRF